MGNPAVGNRYHHDRHQNCSQDDWVLFRLQLWWQIHFSGIVGCSWIGHQKGTRTKILKLPRHWEGYDKFKTLDEKLSPRRIHWCCDPSSMVFFGELILENKWKIPKKLWSRHRWMRLIKSSSTKISGPFEMPRFVGNYCFIASQAGVFVFDDRVDRVLARQLSTSKTTY